MSILNISEVDTSKTVCICKKKLKISTIFVGFPGQGLVGSIAAKYIVKELEMEVNGFIRSPLIPPLAVFLDGILAYPYRIYTKDNIAVLIGESPAPAQAYYHLSNAVLDWAADVGATEIVCLDGFPDQNPGKAVYLVAEPDQNIDNQVLKEKIDKLALPKPQTGYIGGLSGAILNETILRDIDGYALLCGTDPSGIPDPLGAANIINVLNELKDINVDTKSLESDGEKIKKTFREFADRTKHQQDADMSITESSRNSTLYS